jgi:Zn-dependent protease with chaperone function
MRSFARASLLAVVVGMAVLLDWAPAQAAGLPGQDPRYEAALREELRAKASDLVETWDRANTDRSEGRSLAARDGYAKIISALPDFDHAHRRLCSVEPDHGRAVAACRKALLLRASWENHAGLAAQLASDKDGIGEARAEADAAARQKSDEPTVLALQAQLDLAAGDTQAFRTHYATLKHLAPDHPATTGMAVFAALVDGDTGGARDAFARAKNAGAIPPDQVGHIEELIARVENTWTPARIAKTFGMTLAAWLGIILALFTLGSALSKATLRHTEDAEAARDGATVGGTRGLKRLYRLVITVAGVVYWVSLPFVALLVLVGVAAVIYLCLVAGRIPIKALLILVVVAASSVWALIKSVVITLRKRKDEDPGEALVLAEHPQLASLLAEVSSRVGTRTVDKVFLTAGTDMAVYERGGAIAIARGRGERCLIVGAGVLRGLRLGALKGVLAHEFGHFKNEDTAGGSLSLSVRKSMVQMLVSLIQGGAASSYNPAWLFATRYHRIFLRISQGASRLQEVLADRWAVLAYGSEPFVRGFEHVIRRTVEHKAHVEHTLKEVTTKDYALANLFTHVPEIPLDPSECTQTIREALEREADEYDSHPSPKARIAFARALAVDHAPEPGDDDEAWSLLENRDALEVRLTDVVCENIEREHAIVIRRAA